jgi:hypothetical protein
MPYTETHRSNERFPNGDAEVTWEYFCHPKAGRIGTLPLQLRSTPNKNLRKDDVNQRQGLVHLYDTITRNGINLVNDYATGLTWQQSGSTETMIHTKAQQYIRNLNKQKLAGYNDWRLPTLEEAMSLMEPTQKNGNFYIDPLFDKTQRWIWTADKSSAGVAWGVDFGKGNCSTSLVDVDYGYHVRAVRSGQSSTI